MQRIKVLMVDDHEILRDGLKRILAEDESFAVMAEAGTVDEALSHLRQMPIDVVLLDISLPGRSGLDLLRAIGTLEPRPAVLVLSMYAENQYAMRALKYGADGYLTKKSAGRLLVEAMHKVAAGGKYVSPALAEQLALNVVKPVAPTRESSLSAREFEVLRAIAGGRSLTSIAEDLHLSVKTIGTYRSRILGKTGLSSNAALTRYALQEGLID